MKEIEYLESIGKLEIKPGDLVVIKVKDEFTLTNYEALMGLINAVKENFKKAGINNEIMFITDSVDIGVLRGEDGKAKDQG